MGVLEFGSRSGSCVALVFFSVVFGALGWMSARRLRQSTGSLFASGVGLGLFLGPVIVFYASSLGGFYEAVIDGDGIRLHYLPPGLSTDVALIEVAEVRASPAHKGGWRLLLIDRHGRSYESAISDRRRVVAAAKALRR